MKVFGQNPKYRKPETVFTPRGDTVTEMYIPRTGLEERLKQFLVQPMHVLLHGESGCGKTWLYKKIFSDEGIYYRTANLGRALTGGIDALLLEVLAKISDRELVGVTEAKGAKVSAVVSEGEISSEKEYEIRRKDSFEILLSEMRKRAGKKGAVLVFENLEQALDDDVLLKQITGLLLLLDDNDYAKYQVRILLVTTASDFRSYLSRISKSNTITNRIREVPEVGRLLQSQAINFVDKGLFKLLGLEISSNSEYSKDWYVDQIIFFSDRIPQYMHELCLKVALLSEKTGRFLTRELLTAAVADWVKESLISELTVVSSNLNSKATKKGRRNQLLYAIACCKDAEFDYQKIEKIIRSEFPVACDGITLNVSQGLSELASAKLPLIRKIPGGSSYRIIDPRHRILVRWMLFKEKGTETIQIKSFDDGVAL